MLRTITTISLLSVSVLMTACVQVLPEVHLVEVVHEGQTLARIEPTTLEDTTIDVDVPVDAHFVVHFTEPVQLSSLDGAVRIRDENEGIVDVEFDTRLEVVRLRPIGQLLEPGQNHTLEIDSGVEDTSGYISIEAYRINFYTEDPNPGEW